jgi:hypothetical protein
MKGALALTVATLGLLAMPGAPLMAQAPPSIRIVAPSNGTAVAPDRVRVVVDVRNLALDAAAVGTAPVAGEGHWHVYVDGRLAGISAGRTFDLPARLFAGTAGGWHVVRVQLCNNDHTPVPGAQTSWIVVLRTVPGVR